MSTLILVRHSNSQPVPGVDANEWQLSADGVRRATQFAAQLRPFRPNRIFTSTERKAQHTGELLAEALGLTISGTDPAFDEHDRRGGKWFESIDDFRAAVGNFFEQPDELVYGRESAETALTRFTIGINKTIQAHSGENIIIVSHGTVIALFTAAFANDDAKAIWLRIQQLGMPVAIVLDTSSHQIVAFLSL